MTNDYIVTRDFIFQPVEIQIISKIALGFFGQGSEFVDSFLGILLVCKTQTQ